ncbi:hypothetical protein HY29_11705 [Hyphomonas beringensis]|uniref:Uncharacterized protein n=1 Tax=Hyphomonas beringensis TaxID=1280946 RepID=A0A062UG49_9PROT|nr:hypothetical protein [Hyphomonas beringensis]KCZ55574.1 hypothetical protein HY29_11705 [Hyphomonas beringensis]
MDQLFAPPRNLTPELEPYRFWIWLQLIVVRMYIRSIKGPGVPFMFKMNRHGDVTLVYIGDTEAEREAALAKQKQQDPFAWEPGKAFTAALDGSVLMSAHPGESRGPGQQAQDAQFWISAVAGMSANVVECVLPPPDT